ncbi:MAG: phage late control D family protein, partial [Bacteroidia bacterium]
MSSFRILIDGVQLEDKYGVSAIMVNKTVNKIPFAQLVIIDGDVSKQDFPASSSEVFVPGKKVTIKMGYDSLDKKVFEGIIIKHSIQMQGNSMFLTVELRDEAVKLTVGRKNKFFENKLDSAIMEEVLGGFAGTVMPTTTLQEEMVQYFCTDWDFVLSRADVNGMLVFVEDG